MHPLYFLVWLLLVDSLTPVESSTKTETTHNDLVKEKTKIVAMQTINNEKPFEGQEYLSEGNQQYPVIFEPLRHVKLSRSTYKVTSFVDFAPYINSFVKFQAYLEKFIHDVQSHDYTGEWISGVMKKYLMKTARYNIHDIGKQCNKEEIIKYCSLPRTLVQTSVDINNREQRETAEINCRVAQTMMCNLRKQTHQLTAELKEIQWLYVKVKEKFYDAIDYLEKEGKENNEDTSTRNKRHVEKEQRARTSYSKLSKTEEKLLEQVLTKLKNYNPEIHRKVTRHKRFGIMSWILGWGIFSNARAISSIKKNIKTLMLQNILQDTQIHGLAHFLNLTATHVRLNREVIYKIQTELESIKHTLTQVMVQQNAQTYVTYIIQNIRTAIGRFRIGLSTIQHNTEKIYEYMRVMASHETNPMIIPAPMLRRLLADIEREMQSNPRLELPYQLKGDEIWKYYEIMRVTPVVMEDLMVILLTIPLIDRSLEMEVFRVHSMPALNQNESIRASYEIEGRYLAVGKHGMYVALPEAEDIHMCLVTAGGLCTMNQALYPTETVEWCVYALFIKNEKRITKHCRLNFTPQKENKAQSLGGYLWAVSSLVEQKIQIRCLTETHIENIKPPLQIIYVGNGCEGYTPTLYIPAKNELTTEMDIAERATYFARFSYQYQKENVFECWLQLGFTELSQEQIEKRVKKLPQLPPMNIESLNQELPKLDLDYPLSVSPNTILFVLVAMALVYIAIIIIVVLKLKGARSALEILKPIKRMVAGKGSEEDADVVQRNLMNVLVRSIETTQQSEKKTTSPRPHVQPKVAPRAYWQRPLPQIIEMQDITQPTTSEEQSDQAEVTIEHELQETTPKIRRAVHDIIKDSKDARRYKKYLDDKKIFKK